LRRCKTKEEEARYRLKLWIAIENIES